MTRTKGTRQSAAAESAVPSFAAMSLDGPSQTARAAKGLIVTDLVTGQSHFEEGNQCHGPEVVPGSIEGTANHQNQPNPLAFDSQTAGARETCLDNERYFLNQAAFRDDHNPTDLGDDYRLALFDQLSNMAPRSQAHRAIMSILTYGLPGDEYDPDIKKQAAESVFAESEQGTAFLEYSGKLNDPEWGVWTTEDPQECADDSAVFNKPQKSKKSKKLAKSTRAGNSTTYKTSGGAFKKYPQLSINDD